MTVLSYEMVPSVVCGESGESGESDENGVDVSTRCGRGGPVLDVGLNISLERSPCLPRRLISSVGNSISLEGMIDSL